MTTKLFLVRRVNRVSWDENEAHVIRAENEDQARDLAILARQDDKPVDWMPPNATVTEIPMSGRPEVIFTSTTWG